MKSTTQDFQLGDLVEVASGQVDPRQSPFSEMPHVGGDNIESHTGRLSGMKSAAVLGLTSGKYLFNDSDILYSKIRPNLNKVAAPDFDGICSADIYPIRPIAEKIEKRYLLYVLRSKEFLAFAEQHSTRTNIPKINRNALLSYSVPLPPLPEQKRIADILDKADAIRRKRQQGLAEIDQLIRSTFIGELGNPRTNPHGWPIEKLGDVINFVGGSQPPKETFISEPRDGYVRLVQIRDFKSDKYPTFIPRELARRFFEKDDVMIARYGPPVFQILRGLEGSYNVALMKAENTERTLKEFIFYLLQIPDIHDVVVANSERTAGQSGTNLPLLQNLEIPIPPVHQQHKITSKLNAIEAFQTRCSRFLEDSETLFNSLVQRAFKGELPI